MYDKYNIITRLIYEFGILYDRIDDELYNSRNIIMIIDNNIESVSLPILFFEL